MTQQTPQDLISSAQAFCRLAENETNRDRGSLERAAQYAVPDSRDERIATLEAALRHIRTLAGGYEELVVWKEDVLAAIYDLAHNALAGEAQPTSTVDEAMAI